MCVSIYAYSYTECVYINVYILLGTVERGGVPAVEVVKLVVNLVVNLVVKLVCACIYMC